MVDLLLHATNRLSILNDSPAIVTPISHGAFLAAHSKRNQSLPSPNSVCRFSKTPMLWPGARITVVMGSPDIPFTADKKNSARYGVGVHEDSLLVTHK
jgi:hypothetical protein